MKQVFTFLVLFLCSFAASAQLNMELKSVLAFGPGVELANLWGYTGPNGNEYALVGTTDGMHIVDVTDPYNPVNLHHVPGPQSIWREVRTHQNYAYVATEGGGGLQIVDLSGLPNSINVSNWTGNGAINGNLTSIHTLHIDNGHVYLYGSKLFNGAPIIASLADPLVPQYLGHAGNVYCHDGFVRNDTLFGAHIYAGYFSVFDVSDKASPVLLQTHETPHKFTHNTWLSDDGRTLFTTDEVNNSFLASYDISDLNDIRELSRIQSNPGSNSMVHNTHLLNDFAVTSWYRDGVVIVDGNRPENLVVVGSFDTSPLSGGGSNGCWGVYPYFQSGNIIASDMEQGLYVLGADYLRACYLEGQVTDSICGTPLSNVEVTIGTVNTKAKTNGAGFYKNGTAIPGTYTVTFSAPGYSPRTFSGITLDRGLVEKLDVRLFSSTTVAINGTVEKATDGTALEGSFVLIENPVSTYSFTTNADGEFSRCNLLSGNYQVTTGKWGYVSECSQQSINASAPNLSINLKEGYYDDFTFNYGWTVSGNASAGKWERGKPVGTFFNGIPVNPGSDVSDDCSDRAYVTGNGGGQAGNDDVDDGRTVLTSPVFDLTNYQEPRISYYRWFYNGGGGSAPNDTLTVRLSNGLTSVVLETVLPTTPKMSEWVRKEFVVKDFIAITPNMQISFDAVDANPGHLVEAGVDKFEVFGDVSGAVLNEGKNGFLRAFPNPFTNQLSLDYNLDGETSTGARLVVMDITGRQVFEKQVIENIGTLTLDLALPEGLYFVVLASKQGNTPVIKVVKTN